MTLPTWIVEIPNWLQKYQHVVTVVVGFVTTVAGSVWVGWRRVQRVVSAADAQDGTAKYTDLLTIENRLTVRMDLMHQDIAQTREDFSHVRKLLDKILLGDNDG